MYVARFENASIDNRLIFALDSSAPAALWKFGRNCKLNNFSQFDDLSGRSYLDVVSCLRWQSISMFCLECGYTNTLTIN